MCNKQADVFLSFVFFTFAHEKAELVKEPVLCTVHIWKDPDSAVCAQMAERERFWQGPVTL